MAAVHIAPLCAEFDGAKKEGGSFLSRRLVKIPHNTGSWVADEK